MKRKCRTGSDNREQQAGDAADDANFPWSAEMMASTLLQGAHRFAKRPDRTAWAIGAYSTLRPVIKYADRRF